MKAELRAVCCAVRHVLRPQNKMACFSFFFYTGGVCASFYFGMGVCARSPYFECVWGDFFLCGVIFYIFHC
jgi:hypothetical protein